MAVPEGTCELRPADVRFKRDTVAGDGRDRLFNAAACDKKRPTFLRRVLSALLESDDHSFDFLTSGAFVLPNVMADSVI